MFQDASSSRGLFFARPCSCGLVKVASNLPTRGVEDDGLVSVELLSGSTAYLEFARTLTESSYRKGIAYLAR